MSQLIDSEWLDESEMDLVAGAASTPIKESSKRRREPADPSGFTPQTKGIKKEPQSASTLTILKLRAALRHCICAEEGSVLMRATILAQLEMQGFNEVSHMSLGMSLKREFPGVIRFGRSKDQYRNIALTPEQRPALPASTPRRGIVFTDPTVTTPVPKITHTSQAGTPITLRNSTPSSQASSSSSPFTMTLSFNELKLIGAVREGDDCYIQKAMLECGLQSACVDATCKLVRSEISAYSSNINNPLLQHTKPEQLLNFSLPKLLTEFTDKVPTLLNIISKVIHRGDDRPLRKDFIAVTIVAKILSTSNPKLSLFRYVNSFILDVDGARDKCLKRLACSGDTVMPQTLRLKLTEMASLTSILTKDWDIPRTASSIVFDNVNPFVKPRHQTSDKGNKLYSMCHGLMVRDRVPTAHLSGKPAKTMTELTPSDILPSDTDHHALRSCFIRILRNVWATSIKSLQWMSTEIPKHRNAKFTREKTEFVNLGVMMKDETKEEELLEVLVEYHKTVPISEDGKLDPKLCFGDYLSFRNGMMAQGAWSDRKDPEQRLEGLIMVISDFHAMMNLVDVIYKTAFTADSSKSPGTLSHAKVYLNAGNAGAQQKASKKYYDSSELSEKVFEAYVITEILDRLWMDSPQSDCTLPEDQQTNSRANLLAEEFVEKYVDLQLPGAETKDNTKRCPYCEHAPYKTTKGLTNHLEKMHPDMPELLAHPGCDDGVLAYTIQYVTLSLLRLTLKEAVRAANGELVMSVYRYLFIICKAVGNNNYSNAIAETLIQTYVLPEKLAQSLIWNRFVNTAGRINSNIAIDQHMEHENKMFLSQLTTYRGQYTQDPIDRISKSQTVVNAILNQYDVDIHSRTTGSRATKPVSKEDVLKLVKVYQPARLFDDKPGRNHSPELVFTRRNVMERQTKTEVNEWLINKFRDLGGIHIYEQFVTREDEDFSSFMDLDASMSNLSIAVEDDDSVFNDLNNLSL